MDHVMPKTDQLQEYRTKIRQVFEQQVQASPSDGLEETLAICDEQTDNYLLMNVGWQGYQRQHGVFVHLRIVRKQIHVEWNGTEDIIEALMALGIPESAFVPVFRHPDLREALVGI
ncbi:MAG: element excision factor XisI family protein [Cyanobacteria bacterium P01_G01_bin.54]